MNAALVAILILALGHAQGLAPLPSHSLGHRNEWSARRMLDEDADEGTNLDDSDSGEGPSLADAVAARVVNSTCAPGCSEHGVCNEELGR